MQEQLFLWGFPSFYARMSLSLQLQTLFQAVCTWYKCYVLISPPATPHVATCTHLLPCISHGMPGIRPKKQEIVNQECDSTKSQLLDLTWDPSAE